MKKLSIGLSVALILTIASIPYIIGRCAYVNAGNTICYLMDDDYEDDCDYGWGTDGDIENVLAVNNIQLDGIFSSPTFGQYYKAGIETIYSSINHVK